MFQNVHSSVLHELNMHYTRTFFLLSSYCIKIFYETFDQFHKQLHLLIH